MGPAPATIVQWLRRGDRSAAALEFGIVAIPFVGLLLLTFEISFDLYVQAALDNVAAMASRSVQVGGTTGVASETSATFVAGTICPNLGGLLDCGLITAAVAPIPAGANYSSTPVQFQLNQIEANSGGGICTGTPEQMMVLRIWYDGPTFVGFLVPSFSTGWNGALVHETVATAGFVNEYFTGGQSAGSACSL
jgi:Flp pilus assembly protein TadG